jgi:glycosyltransferase involved in cell wall biosynthesis
MKATFLLSKDPGIQSTGDLTTANLVMSLARESFDIGVVCLSEQPQCTHGGYRRVAKPAVRPGSLMVDSLRRRRSLVHTRFAFEELVEAVDQTETDIFVAIHSYMAEAVMRSQRFAAVPKSESMLAVSTEVPEAPVWRQTRPVIGLAECPRIRRDEVRVARNAYSVGAYDRTEAEFYAGLGGTRAHWLDITLPPMERIAVANTGPRLVFLGDRRWPPNQKAYETLLKLWPRIAKGIEGAQLYIVGAADPKAKARPLPPEVHDLGFVDDLAGLLASCRAMVAPITTGGGVRVKILDAASRGLPVVGTSAAIGSLNSVLDIEVFDDESSMTEQCRRYLRDPRAAAMDGDMLHERNGARWRAGKPHAAVQDWLER